VTHPVALDAQVAEVVLVGTDAQRYASDDLEAESLEPSPLGRVVGQQPHRANSQVDEYLGHVSQAFRDLGIPVDGSVSTRVPDLATATSAVRQAYESGYAQAVADLFLLLVPLTLVPLASVILLTGIRLSRSIRRWPEIGEAEAI
jgi:hypothetical protein